MAVLIVMVMLVLPVAMAVLIVMVMLMLLMAMAMLIMVILMLLLQFRKRQRQRSFSLHSLPDLTAGQIIPGSCNDGSLRIMLPEERDCSIQLLLGNRICAGHDNRGSSFDLVVIELTKVLHIHLYFACINDRNRVSQGNLAVGNLINSGDHIGELTYSGGLNNDPVGSIFADHLRQSFAKITNQTAADTT